MGFNDSVRRLVNETASAAYSATMRMVSTEASANARANDACFKDFQLIEIPRVMETRMNAPVGAALMRRWFNGQPHVLSDAMKTSNVDYRTMPRHTVDTAIVKIGWATRFARTRDALAALETRRVNTPAAGRELRRVLMRENLLNKRCYQIGTSRDAITLHETAHLNSIIVTLSDSTDPLDCALGTFSLHMAITGTVQPLRRRVNNASHEVEITHLHFYIRDNYDFTGDAEPLGHWGQDGASRMPSSGKSFVENRSFREWRARHGRGGDFVVFSDIMTKQLARPVEIFI